jgi:hypothetical protein
LLSFRLGEEDQGPVPRHLLGKGKEPNQLQWVVRQTMQHYGPDKTDKVRLRIDMVPLSML